MPGESGLHNAITTMPGAAAPAPAPLAPAPEPAPPRRTPLLIVVGLLVLVAAGITAWEMWRGRGASVSTTVRTAVVAHRDFAATLRVTGLTAAIRSYVIAAPSLTGGGANSMVVTHMAAAGTHVKKGDVLVVFDPQNQIKTAQDKEADYRDLLNQIEKKKADEAAARAKDETELRTTEDAVKSAEWEMRRNEVLSKIDAEKNQETLDQNRAQLKQLQATFELKRKAAQADLHILEISRDRARNDMLHAQHNAQRMEIRAPMDGVVVLNSIWKSGNMGEVQEGDEVRPGVPFMQVMDPSSMQALVRVNQSDIGYLKVGQTGTVHLDAYPGLTLKARLDSLDSIAVGSIAPKVRVFSAVFSIAGADPKLMPDLSAAIDVELGSVPHALVAPRDAIVHEGGKAYAWTKQGSGFHKVEVTEGSTSDMDVVISFGLKDGDVVLRNPESAAVAR